MFCELEQGRRITFDDDHLFIDLVFYNILLKCYSLIDLTKPTHQDVGQMDSSVRIFDAHERTPGDGPTTRKEVGKAEARDASERTQEVTTVQSAPTFAAAGDQRGDLNRR